MRKFIAIAVLFFALVSCSSNIREEFDTVFTKYNDALTSNDLRLTFIFVADKAREPYLKSYEASKNARLFECRIVKKTVDELKREARVEVEIDYYMLNSNRVKTLRYVQEWSHIEENKVKDWKLLTPLPEFK
jgi:hypothetical protein